MVLSIFRQPSSWNFMLSKWLVDSQPYCVGIELPAKPPVPGGYDAIPAGTYQVKTTYSNRLSALAGHPTYTPQLLDMPGKTTWLSHPGGAMRLNDCGIRIHPGNVVNGKPAGTPGGPKSPYDPKDPNRTDSKRCLLPGLRFGADKKSVESSRDAYGPLAARIAAEEHAGHPITLIIR